MIERAWKWYRRHQVISLVTFGLMASLMVGTVISLWQRELARGEASRALLAEQDAEKKSLAENRQRRNAENARNQAREALESMTSPQAMYWITRQSRISPEQREFLEGIAKAYRELASEDPEDEKSRSFVANAIVRNGMLEYVLGYHTACHRSLEQGIVLYRSLIADFPDNESYAFGLSQAHHFLAALNLYKNPTAAKADFGHAIKLLTPLITRKDAERMHLEQLAAALTARGNIHVGGGKYSEATIDFHEAERIYALAVKRFSGETHLKNLQAYSWSCQGGAARLQRKLPAAESLQLKALNQLESIHRQFPADEECSEMLVRCQHEMAQLLSDQRKGPEAIEKLTQAIIGQRELLKMSPAIPEYRRMLGNLLGERALILSQLLRQEEAKDDCNEALKLLGQLAREFPENSLYAQNLAAIKLIPLANGIGRVDTWLEWLLPGPQPKESPNDKDASAKSIREWAIAASNRAYLFKEKKQYAEAEVAFTNAITHWETLATRFPQESTAFELSRCLTERGDSLAQQKKMEAAQADYSRAIPLLQKLHLEEPKSEMYASAYARLIHWRGYLLSNDDLHRKNPEIIRDYREAISTLEPLIERAPRNVEYWTLLGGAYCNLGNFLQSSDSGEALKSFSRAIERLGEATRKFPASRDAKLYLRNSYWGRGQTLLNRKHYAESIADWDRALQLDENDQFVIFRIRKAWCWICLKKAEEAVQTVEMILGIDHAHPNGYAFAAGIYSMASELDLAKQESFREKSLQLTRKALAKGYRDFAYLNQHVELKAMQGRADFKALVTEYESKSLEKNKSK